MKPKLTTSGLAKELKKANRKLEILDQDLTRLYIYVKEKENDWIHQSMHMNLSEIIQLRNDLEKTRRYLFFLKEPSSSIYDEGKVDEWVGL